jgi:CHAT domain-containing protein
MGLTPEIGKAEALRQTQLDLMRAAPTYDASAVRGLHAKNGSSGTIAANPSSNRSLSFVNHSANSGAGVRERTVPVSRRYYGWAKSLED